MFRATQMLAYHGRTALLLGPMPRRTNLVAANSPHALRSHLVIAKTVRAEPESETDLLNRLHNILLDGGRRY
jgi:hypothetical protein